MSMQNEFLHAQDSTTMNQFVDSEGEVEKQERDLPGEFGVVAKQAFRPQCVPLGIPLCVPAGQFCGRHGDTKEAIQGYSDLAEWPFFLKYLVTNDVISFAALHELQKKYMFSRIEVYNK